ncbi:L,D-transpeptidase family protein [Adhaeribacter radiodurans]|uniref:L,D-transpeptidase family protein n=1 Tax=Adhaeribacter radiodurans TaxID=2745197 RepID=A0A7L7L118_9BACT|nr:L,D-transpeptidase family protein [Adhaeribacter radiodurans]QMU26493.1 L,D-transpeptidase family protein [Adhaeribacter radiodurans]
MGHVRNFTIYLPFYFSLLLFTSCNQKSKSVDNKLPQLSAKDSTLTEIKKTVSGNFSAQTELNLDSTYLSRFFQDYPEFNSYQVNVKKFYQDRDFAYAWFDQQGLIEQASNVANRVINIEQEGIGQVLPYRQEFDSLLAESQQEATVKPNPKTELMLTAGYFAFARTAWGGLNDSISQAMQWFVPRKKIPYTQLLDSLLSQPASLTREPVYHQYELLRSFLRRYQEIDKKQEWEIITAKNNGYRQGDKAVNILLIKQRLQVLGDFSGDTASQVFDADLVAAVKQFQKRHGLLPDGAIGSNTLAELNTPLKERLRHIMVNMERSRWLPVQEEDDYLVVNIPDFKLHVYRNDSLAWSCRVVVGKSVHKTVIFSGEIKYVVFSPYWYVPASIVRREIVPGIRRSATYLKRHNMEQIGHRNGLPVIRQKPGPTNSLGQVKFLFPNSYSIYLHDTPSKSLFKENSRAFSHGCIRVSEPARLAAYLLRDYPEWTNERIQTAMQAGREQTITLEKQVPVYLVYFTTFIDSQGNINFRKDIYDRDERLAEVLFANAAI